jgi:osmoprotectant transport system substrate-binding protein
VLGCVAAVAAVVAIGLAALSDGPSSSGARAEPSTAAAIRSDPGNRRVRLVIGSQRFAEQLVLAEIYAQALARAGFTVRRETVGSPREGLRELRAGRLDGAPEYSGTALRSLFGMDLARLPGDPARSYAQVRSAFARRGLVALPPAPFSNTYALAASRTGAKELGRPATIGELARGAKELRVSGFPDCALRPDCLGALRTRYGLRPRLVPTERKYEPLDSNEADVGIVFSTDGELSSRRYVTFADDRRAFPAYVPSLVLRRAAFRRLGPAGRDVVRRVQRSLTQARMRELNARVELRGQRPVQVARDHLRRLGFAR